MILDRSIQIYLVTFVQKKTDYLRSLFIDLTKILDRAIQIYMVTFVQKKTDYLRSLFIDLTKILNRSIQIYLVTFENRLSKITLYRSDQDSEQINSDLSGNIFSNYLRSLFIDLTKILNGSIQIYLVTFV